ncbi:family 20 glycosylhydrolase [Micromonospora sp. LZ34]
MRGDLVLNTVRRAAALGLGAALGAALLAAPTTVAASAVNPASRPGGAGAVVPRPTSWQPAEGVATIGTGTRILVDPLSGGRWTTGADQPGLAHRPTVRVALALADELREVAGFSPQVSADVRTADQDDIVVRLVDDSELGAEGYQLRIGGGPTQITAGTSTGVHYAGRTLEQMLTSSGDGRSLQAGTVRDVPDQQYRQVMLDAGRKYWQPDYLKNLVRQMSWHKMNTLFLHLSDAEGFRLDSRAFPGLADPDVSYDEEEIADLVAFAADHHVMVVPGIDVPGHGTVLSDHFQIGFGDGANPCLRAHMHSHLTPDWAIDITDARSTQTSVALLEEFLPWFDAPYAHLGADELPGQLGNCPRVRNALDADPDVSTLGDLLSRFINDLDDTVNRLGKRTIIYNGVEHMSSPQQDVHDDVVFMTWEHSSSEPAVPGKDEIAIGPFYVTPNNYHNLYPNEGWMYDTWEPSLAEDMIGSGIMNWADYNFWARDEYYERLMAMPRAILADRTWNATPTRDTVTDFRARVAALGPAPGVDEPEAPERVDDGHPSHHWTFDDASYPSGWTYAGSPGNTIFAEDVAGDLPGTSYIINNPTPVAGISGQAWHFDNDRDGVGFGGLDVAPPWTFSAWVRRTGSTGNATLISSKSTALKLEQWGAPCGQVGFTKKGVADHTFDYVTPIDEWVHLTFVTKPDRTELFVNGEYVDSVDAAVDLPMRSIGDVGSSVRGTLDEVQTYDEALTPEAVRAAYESFGVVGSAKQAPCLRSVAVGAAAVQSSTAYGGVAGRAVDGNTSGSWGSGSVTHTAEDKSPEPYWQADLGRSYTPAEIAVWNRTDCCGSRLSNYYVLFSEQPIVGTSLADALATPGVHVYYQAGTAGLPTRIPTGGASGRYVRVQLAGTAPLSLAEVQVNVNDSRD